MVYRWENHGLSHLSHGLSHVFLGFCPWNLHLRGCSHPFPPLTGWGTPAYTGLLARVPCRSFPGWKVHGFLGRAHVPGSWRLLGQRHPPSWWQHRRDHPHREVAWIRWQTWLFEGEAACKMGVSEGFQGIEVTNIEFQVAFTCFYWDDWRNMVVFIRF